VAKPKKENKTARPKNHTIAEDIAKFGLEAIPVLMDVLINKTTVVDRSKHLQADQYEHP
jgi:hypothetical protein